MKIKLEEGARLPEYGTRNSAGLDLYVLRKEFDYNDDVWIYHTGVHAKIPDGFVGLLFPRSSVCHKSLTLNNCVGVVDSDYTGEIMAKFHLRNDKGEMYEVGDKFCQLVIVPFRSEELEVVDELPKTERGEGGYGSTGK